MKMDARVSKLGLPWVQFPFISNAPMGGVAGSRLAVAVTRAGGLGQIGFTGSPRLLENELAFARSQLQSDESEHKIEHSTQVPVAAGIIVFGAPMEAFVSVIARHKPAVVWLSFATVAEFQQWTIAIRQQSPLSKVWIQIGSVRAALEAARCQPDALVLQGSDAGGHGHESGASIVSLIPEVADSLQNTGNYHIPLIAAGGIMDGRGAAAALVLGASGIVMGTRFLGAEEAEIPEDFRTLILEASDGGESTGRSRAFDAMWGPNIWPEMYDGRCLKNSMYQMVKDGLSDDEARRRLCADTGAIKGQGPSAKDTMCVWTGTGVGLVNRIEKAGDIVEQVREDTLKNLVRFGKVAQEKPT